MSSNSAHWHTAFLSLGSNLGDRNANIARAVSLIAEKIGSIEALSSLYETVPDGFASDNLFINAAVKISTALQPLELLHATQLIEKSMGRKHKSVNNVYHDRIIDIDILLYDSIILNTPELTIPHPEMNRRSFVLEPLSEILSITFQ
jgi:2-amino-4-hydroxy-6-hydroxymethyldihydropteridine diphosphokinase